MQRLRRIQQAEGHHTRGHMWRCYTHVKVQLICYTPRTRCGVGRSFVCDAVRLHVLTAPHLKGTNRQRSCTHTARLAFTQERARLSPYSLNDALPLRASPFQHALPPVATTAVSAATAVVHAGSAFTLGCLDQATPPFASLSFASRTTTRTVEASRKHGVRRGEKHVE